jgi:uncharacterized membrane protein
VIAFPLPFDKMFDASFSQIRQNSRGNLAVMLRLLRAVRLMIGHLHDRGQMAHLRSYAQMIHAQALQTASEEYDRRAVQTHFDAVMSSIEHQMAHHPG